MVEPARTETQIIPAEYGTIEKRTLLTEEKAEWRQVLCEANANTTVISAIQRALKTQGYYNGGIDGRLGQQTYNAVEQFQKARNLSTGGLTLTTVEALGVDWRSMVTGSFNSRTTTTYTINSSNQVIDGAGTVIGRLDSNGNVVNGGRIILRSGTFGMTRGTNSGTSTFSGASGYTIGSNGQVMDRSGTIIGRLDGSGNIVDGRGNIIARAGSFGGGSSSTTTTTSSSMSYTVRGDGTVVNAATGAVIGRVDGAGNIVGTGGNIIARAGTFGGGTTSTSSSSMTTGFSVRTDGSVVDGSGTVIGRVDGSGNIINSAGQIIGPG